MQRGAAEEDAMMVKRAAKKAPEMHPEQAHYASALAAYETAIEAHNAECRAAGWWDRDDDEALDLIEASAERHGTACLFEVLHAAEKAMIVWSIESVRGLATQQGRADELPSVDALERRPALWARAVDLAFRKAA